VLDLRMPDEIDLAGDLDTFVLCLDAVKLDAGRGRDRFDAFEAAEEIEVPPGPTEFAVGRELQADLLLLPDDFLDLAVLDRFQRCGVNFTFGTFCPCFLQWRRTQKTANVIGTEGRRRAGIHLPHTSSANSTIMRSFAHCSSSASTLPSSVDAKPHCGDRQS